MQHTTIDTSIHFFQACKCVSCVDMLRRYVFEVQVILMSEVSEIDVAPVVASIGSGLKALPWLLRQEPTVLGLGAPCVRYA